MNVDGTSSKTFSYSPGSGFVALTRMSCLLKHDGQTSFNKFGALNALTNGILIQTNIGGNIKDIATIKDNVDLSTRFNLNQFGNSAVLSVLSVATPQGFGSSNNVFMGTFLFPRRPRQIVLSNSDSISVVIRDNISSVELLNMVVEMEIE